MGRATREMQHAKRDAFLAAFTKLGTLTHAAEAAGCDRGQHYRWMDTDPEYPHLFSEASKSAHDNLEREAVRRAVEGTEKPVYQGGKLVGTIREYSDTLLIFIMKGAMPSKYRERVEVTLDVPSLAGRIALEAGMETDALIAEAERIVAGER